MSIVEAVAELGLAADRPALSALLASAFLVVGLRADLQKADNQLSSQSSEGSLPWQIPTTRHIELTNKMLSQNLVAIAGKGQNLSN